MTAVTGASGFWSRKRTSELMSAKPSGNAPVATFGIASREPEPALISTSRSLSPKWPSSIARKNGADGPSNFQSRANGTSVAAWAAEWATEAVSRVAAAAVRRSIGRFREGDGRMTEGTAGR